MAEIDVTFTDDIPKIEREGGTRESKYRPLLDACVERPGKAARIVVDTQGQASSRASSIKDAASKHPEVTEGNGHFVVATRSQGDDEFHVYCKYEEGPAPEDESGAVEAEEKPKKKSKKKKSKKSS